MRLELAFGDRHMSTQERRHFLKILYLYLQMRSTTWLERLA